MPPRRATLKNGKKQLGANEFYLPHFQNLSRISAGFSNRQIKNFHL
jgi:hypothetical protein